MKTGQVYSCLDNQILLTGQWLREADSVRPATITADLVNRLQFGFRGRSCSLIARSLTGKKIAAVITINGTPIDQSIAGDSVRYGEGQSYIFVEAEQEYGLIKGDTLVDCLITVATRSDKLVCISFKVD